MTYPKQRPRTRPLKRALPFAVPLVAFLLMAVAASPARGGGMHSCLEGVKCDGKPPPCYEVQMIRAALREDAYRSDWIMDATALSSETQGAGISGMIGRLDKSLKGFVNVPVADQIKSFEELAKAGEAYEKELNERGGSNYAREAANVANQVQDIKKKIQELNDAIAGKGADGKPITPWDPANCEQENAVNEIIKKMGDTAPSGYCKEPPEFRTDSSTCQIGLATKADGKPGPTYKGDASSIWENRFDNGLAYDVGDVCSEAIAATLMHEQQHRARCLAARAGDRTDIAPDKKAESDQLSGKTPYRQRGRSPNMPRDKERDARDADAAYRQADDEADSYMNELAILQEIFRQAQANCKKPKDPSRRTISWDDVDDAMADAMKRTSDFTKRNVGGKPGGNTRNNPGKRVKP